MQQIPMDLLDQTSSAEDSRAKTSRLLVIVRDWLESEADSGGNIYGWSESFGLLGCLSRMSLASYLRTTVRTSRSSSPGLPNAGMVWRGACWIANISECPSDGVESTLSDIWEPHALSKYCLSPKAAAGILRRAQKRGRKLPIALEQALVAVAQMTPTDTLPTSPNEGEALWEQVASDGTPRPRHLSSTLDKIPSSESQPLTRMHTATPLPSELPKPEATGGESPSPCLNKADLMDRPIQTDIPLSTAPVTTLTGESGTNSDKQDQSMEINPTVEEVESWSVRRLTPTECERLQGFPDGWTLLPPMVTDTPPSATP